LCLNCGSELKLDEHLCESCIKDSFNHVLVKLVTKEKSHSFFDRMKSKNSLNHGSIEIKSENVQTDEDYSNLREAKSLNTTCSLCLKRPITNFALNICSNCAESLETSTKKDKKYRKKYHNKLKREKRCTSCKKPLFNQFSKFVIILHSITSMIFQEKIIKMDNIKTKLTCYFCLNDEARIKRKAKNQLKMLHTRKTNNECVRCKKKVKEGKRLCKTHQVEDKLFNRRRSIVKKIKNLFGIDWKKMRNVPEKIKNELDMIILIFYIFEEPFRKWDIKRLDLYSFHELNIIKHRIHEESRKNNFCGRCGKKAKKLLGLACTKCYKNSRIANRKTNLFRKIKEIYFHDLKWTTQNDAPKRFKTHLTNIILLFYCFDEAFGKKWLINNVDIRKIHRLFVTNNYK